MELAWVLALLLVLAGAGYMYLQQQEEAKKQALKLQKEKEELARQQFHALNSKKPKGKAKKKVDVTAKLKKKSQEAAAKDAGEEHESLLHVLKGHKYGITAAAYSPNGRFLATASSDRSIRLYFRETLKDKNPKVHQINMEYDHATAMSFSSDGRSLVRISLVFEFVELH
ncbi:unnamed protein product [Phytophthora fragariaefolia]|uniref:Unnamed protein product n=1 Tax=Phytophthora fragariaefolia TaxID=1490495 RepID=A0A9W6XP86_9STRA|nr:unnamed protein product [Phytophthora fragariaefolia]